MSAVYVVTVTLLGQAVWNGGKKTRVVVFRDFDAASERWAKEAKATGQRVELHRGEINEPD